MKVGGSVPFRQRDRTVAVGTPTSAKGQSHRFGCSPMTSDLSRRTDIVRAGRHVSKGRVEDGRGSLGHSATLRFPSHRVAGGGRPPPAPTERGVRISRTTLLGSWLTAFTGICSSFVSLVS